MQLETNDRFALWLPAAAFLCLGIFFRFYNFWLPNLWIDEYATWWALEGDWSGMVRRVSYIPHSPLYYSIAKLSADLLGIGPFSLRLPSIVFGIGVVGLAYPLGLRLFRDDYAALLAVAAFAVNEPLIWYSQDARPYALALFCAMLSFLFYVSLLSTEKRHYRLGYIVSTAAAFYAHYLFGFIVVVQVVHLFMTRRHSWLYKKAWPCTFLALALLCLPGAIHFANIFLRRESLDWLPPRDWMAAVKLALHFLQPWVILPTAFVVVAVGFVGMKRAATLYRSPLDLILLWFVLPILAFGFIPPLFGVTLLNPRYVVFAAPAALFIMVWVMASVRRDGWYKWLPLAVFLIASIALNLAPAFKTHGTFSRRPNQGWVGAAGFLVKFAGADDLILLGTGFVDANLLARADPDPLLASYVRWPLLAHLPSGRNYKIMDLPFSVNDQTRRYADSVLRTATQYRRVWMIDRIRTGRETPALARALISGSRFRLREQIFYGTVGVFLLEQENK